MTRPASWNTPQPGWEVARHGPLTRPTPRFRFRRDEPVVLTAVGFEFVGLHLFDYVQHCPNMLEGHFWARTGRGIARSVKNRLVYIIGSDIAPARRHHQIMKGEAGLNSYDRWQLEIEQRKDPEQYRSRLEQQAYVFWEQAGRPEGRAQEFWQQAEKALNAELSFRSSLASALRRPPVAKQAGASLTPREQLKG